jgi:hypothetical protein
MNAVVSSAAEVVSIPISVGGRMAWVFQPLVRGVRSETFYVKGNLGGGKQFYRSTGFSAKAMALERAKVLWTAALKGEVAEVKAALEGTKRRQVKPVATIADVVRAHALAAEQGRLHVRGNVAAGYANSLLRVVGWAEGLHEVREGKVRRSFDAQAVGSRSLAVLAAEDFVPRFERAYLEQAKGDKVRREQLLRGAHAVLRNARAMFEPVAMRAYKGLELPDLGHFLKTPMKQARAVQHGRLEDAAVREMALAAMALRESDPELYRVHVALRHLGLRNDELMQARVEWVERCEREVKLPGGELRKLALADGSVIEATVPVVRKVAALFNVTLRAYWEPKGNEGVVAISPEVLAELAPWIDGRKPADFLVPGRTKTEVWELIYVRHADFVRPWTAHLAKRGYELRRWGATKVALLHQSEEMADLFLRHAKTTTAQKHYLTERPLPCPITLGDVGL